MSIKQKIIEWLGIENHGKAIDKLYNELDVLNKRLEEKQEQISRGRRRSDSMDALFQVVRVQVQEFEKVLQEEVNIRNERERSRIRENEVQQKALRDLGFVPEFSMEKTRAENAADAIRFRWLAKQFYLDCLDVELAKTNDISRVRSIVDFHIRDHQEKSISRTARKDFEDHADS